MRFCFVIRTSDKAPEKVEIASVKPVSATMKPITPVKTSSTAATTSAASTTSTSVAVKRKADTPTASHSKRARKDGNTSGVCLDHLTALLFLTQPRSIEQERSQSIYRSIN